MNFDKNYLDIHTHILPSMDDGAKDISESIAMLSNSLAQGVSVCVATPHCILHHDDAIQKFTEKRQKCFDGLIRYIEAKKLNVPKILLGAEVYLDNDINRYKDIDKLCFGNSKFILLEFPAEKQIKNIYDWIYKLTLSGFKPIIAHIDRYAYCDNIMNELKGLDIVYQINASRILSFWGRKKVKKIMGCTSNIIIASDMHNTTTRTCNIKKAYEVAKSDLLTANNNTQNMLRNILC